MIQKKYIKLAIVLLFMAISQSISASTTIIERCFSNGDATVIAGIVSEKVFYVESESRRMIDGVDLEGQLTEFFAANPVSKFDIIHQSEQSAVSYIIGVITTKNSKEYRVHILSKIENNKLNITQIRIEEL